MLRALSIRDFVTVVRLELEFSAGFTALTGETGAGKSILIDALALVLGQRGDAQLVRDGCERAEIGAEFDLQGVPAAAGYLAQADLADADGGCLLRRVLESGGRSRAYVNGRACTLAQLRELGALLVDIHGQHEHQSLLRPAEQRTLLDAFGGCAALAATVAAAHRSWRDAEARCRALERDAQALAQERERLQWTVEDLAAARFLAAEWEALPAEHRRLAHLAQLMEGVERVLDAVGDADDAVLVRLGAAQADLRAGVSVDAALGPFAATLESAALELQEAVYGLRRYHRGLELDPERLQALEQRMAQYHEAARRYRVEPGALEALLAQARAQLAGLEEGLDAAGLERQARAARAACQELAAQLSAARHAAAARLGEQVSAMLQRLAMAGTRFEVALEPLEEPSAGGAESVAFLVSPHPNVPARPLARVASGGELSRVSLAIQAAASAQVSIPTLIFDEVDAGIGGGVAEQVGVLLGQLGRTHQVMCITHLAQVAAAADHHCRVRKSTGAHAAVTQVDTLPAAERVDEIARMMGGVEITAATRTHAAELLERARAACAPPAAIA